MHQRHNLAVGGHLGVKTTQEPFKQHFFSQVAKRQVIQWIKCGGVCQQCKIGRIPLPGLLEPLSVCLKLEHMFRLILLSSYRNLRQRKQFQQLLTFLLDQSFYYFEASFYWGCYDIYGDRPQDAWVSKMLVSNRDKFYTSFFWNKLMTFARTTLHFNSTYHSQTCGHIEQLNQYLEMYLRCMAHLSDVNQDGLFPGPSHSSKSRHKLSK